MANNLTKTKKQIICEDLVQNEKADLQFRYNLIEITSINHFVLAETFTFKLVNTQKSKGKQNQTLIAVSRNMWYSSLESV